MRPLLDGKLDDACWRDVKPIPLTRIAASSDTAGRVKAFADAFKTEARFAYDEQFLYIARVLLAPIRPEG